MRAPTCSVVMATNEPLSLEKQARIEALDQAARAVGGEVLVASGVESAPPHDARLMVTAWLHVPDGGVFALRRAALAQASGDLLVLCEDHCDPAPGWLDALLRVRRTQPDADALVGAVDNGSTTTTIDRASFWVNFGSMRPEPDLTRGTRQIQVAGGALTADFYRRACGEVGMYSPERFTTSQLAALGTRWALASGAVVTHVQTGTWRVHAGRHFHNGRAGTGEAGVRHPRALARVALAPAVLARRVWRTWKGARADGAPLADAPHLWAALGWLYGAKALGELAGLVAGPGDSAQRLE